MRAVILATFALALLQGCRGSDTRDASETTRRVAGQSGAESTVAAPTVRPVSFASDAAIFGMLDAAHVADSAAAAIAATSSTNAEVRAAASAMAREHSALRIRAAELARTLGVVPSRGDTLSGRTALRLAALRDVTRGRDLDRVYLDGVIAAEKSLLRALTSAMDATQTTEVQYLVQQTAPVILSHLNRAEALRAGM